MATTYKATKQVSLRRTFARMQAKGLTIPLTLQMGGTAGAYDPEANASGTVYAHTVELQAFRYNATDAEAQFGISIGAEVLMIQGSDLPADVQPTGRDAVLIGGDAWNIAQVASVPLDLIYLLSISRA